MESNSSKRQESDTLLLSYSQVQQLNALRFKKNLCYKVPLQFLVYIYEDCNRMGSRIYFFVHS